MKAEDLSLWRDENVPPFVEDLRIRAFIVRLLVRRAKTAVVAGPEPSRRRAGRAVDVCRRKRVTRTPGWYAVAYRRRADAGWSCAKRPRPYPNAPTSCWIMPDNSRTRAKQRRIGSNSSVCSVV